MMFKVILSWLLYRCSRILKALNPSSLRYRKRAIIILRRYSSICSRNRDSCRFATDGPRFQKETRWLLIIYTELHHLQLGNLRTIKHSDMFQCRSGFIKLCNHSNNDRDLYNFLCFRQFQCSGVYPTWPGNKQIFGQILCRWPWKWSGWFKNGAYFRKY